MSKIKKLTQDLGIKNISTVCKPPFRTTVYFKNKDDIITSIDINDELSEDKDFISNKIEDYLITELVKERNLKIDKILNNA